MLWLVAVLQMDAKTPPLSIHCRIHCLQWPSCPGWLLPAKEERKSYKDNHATNGGGEAKKQNKNKFYLETDDVSVSSGDLLDYALLPVFPAESPGRAVAIHLLSGVFVTEHVVTHDCERGWPGRRGSGKEVLFRDVIRWAKNTGKSFTTHSGTFLKGRIILNVDAENIYLQIYLHIFNDLL